MSDTVECPYCQHKNDTTDVLTNELSSDNTTDWECSNCEEEFEIHVEFDPSYSAEKIIYTVCESCGNATRDIAEKGRIFPWPENTKETKLCRRCFGKLYFQNQK